MIVDDCGGVILGQGTQVFIRDIKEDESVGQQEQQGDKRDDEEGNEVKGEIEEIRSNAHYIHDDHEMNGDSNLSHSVRASYKEDSQGTTTRTDNKKR